ncbi:DUF6682 family protein [uncultured Marinobacter sp.]|uniref:phage adaptor protein n=1 Tax=uncultured Marinobacter sp. TaxID=187379 RepID=UPI00258D1900|nr:DUF6682 family protein [uncultured Marinobacter sp.]
MAVATVENIVNRARLILQEVTADGTRWTNVELVGWLNEFYPAALQLKPSAFSVNDSLDLVAGSKQTLPAGAHRLLTVIRNLAGDLSAIKRAWRATLDMVRPGWHADPADTTIEYYLYDDEDPHHFYVYPPAEAGASVELVYSRVPDLHDNSGGLTTAGADNFALDDVYVPVALDYILYRAFAKDAETPANLNRSRMHYQAFMGQLTGKLQTDARTSPNAPDSSENPQRGSA